MPSDKHLPSIFNKTERSKNNEKQEIYIKVPGKKYRCWLHWEN